MPGPFMPNNLPKVPHINQLPAGWAGVEIFPLVIRFAFVAMAGNGRAQFAQLCHGARTTDLGKGSGTILANPYLMPSGERVSMRSDRERLKFIKPQEPILVEVPPVSDDWLHEIK